MKTIIENHGKTTAGLIILTIGGLLLLNQVFSIPGWLFSWPMWLIVLGIYVGGKHNFRNNSWAMFIILGIAFLFTENVYHADVVVWPIVIMVTGLWVVFKNSRKIHADY